ncbi:hypothetical protein PINS_up008408 [Pythium insidiosum]|nr:hypothetical protein PINS_up008408 [Pythium insidiosum]
MDGLGDDFVDFLSSLDNISKIVKERKKKDDKQPQRRSRVEEESEEEEEHEEEEEEEEEHDDEDGVSESGSDFDDMEMDEETRREFELLQQEDAEFLQGMDELPTDESEIEEEDDLAAFDSEEEEGDEDEDDDEVTRNTMRNAALASAEGEEEEGDDDDDDDEEHDDSDSAGEEEEEEEEEKEEDDMEEDQEEESDDDDEEEQEKEEVEIEEDIYGRPVIKQREEKKPSAYIPPHLRRQMQQQQQQQQATEETDSKAHLMSTTMDEQALRELTRRVNGQLNRISENNMESIALEMEKIYREHGRSIVNAVLLDKVVQTSCHPRQVMTPLIKVCGALIAALYHSIGTEIGGFFMEKFVMKLIETVEKTTSEPSESDGSDGDSSKEAVNLLLLVAMLYNFGVVQCTLIYDLFRRFLDNFTSTEIELIHHLLKACGHQLRADDQDALREMVASVQQKVAAATSTATSDERVRFILDLIYELKKPAKHSKKGASGLALNAMSASGAMDLTSLKKWLGRVKTRCGNANNALRVSLHEILHAEQNGRWWVVGGTWVGYRQANASADDGKAADQAEENRLLKLAEKQRMNTDVRKRIFVAIMGAADCLDAYERLLQLHLKEKQEREIVRVILHCCGHEKQFNRFYVVLSDKLCEMDPRYKFTYQLAFWDTFKQLESFKPRRLYNMAQLLAGMLMSGSLSLSVLKVLDFTSLDEPTVLFVRIVMEKIMQMDDEAEMTKVFERVLATKKARLTLDGLAVYFHQHMPRYNAETGARQVLKTRTKTVKRLLDMLTKAAVSAEASAEFK